MGRMNLASTAIFLGVIAALCVALRGLFSRRRSVIGGVIAASMALLATGLAWYAWAESESTPWTLGYVVVAVASVASAVRQWTTGSSGR
jgi:multidrug resistance efflux pump